MRLLLLRAVAPNERFGLGPFFRIEPLGLEYIAAAVRRDGHDVAIYDLRFVARQGRGGSLDRILRRERPDVVGIASAHTLDTNEALDVARRVKAFDSRLFTLIGGHAAAVFSEPFTQVEAVDAICCEDGERVVPELLRALSTKQPLSRVAGLISRQQDGHDALADSASFGESGGAPPRFVHGPTSPERVSLDEVPLPARDALVTGHHHYLCVQRRPVYLVETTRGCPYRCSFCTIWQHVDRSFRCRGVASVIDDLASVGRNVFFADDLFWHPSNYSEELAAGLRRWGVQKDWMLVQTRTDLVAHHPELLEKWRPLAKQLDIFFGFESPTDAGLASVQKDQGVAEIEEAITVCRKLGVGITGNFICDPDWDEDDFRRLWDFLAKHRLDHVGFTVLTPLPGTQYFTDARPRIRDADWSHYDMHHILWEPRLGRRRFFELFAETWQRTALNARGPKSWWSYVKQVKARDLPFVFRVLRQSRRLFDPAAYLAEAFPPGPTIPVPEHAFARAAGGES